MNKKPTTGRGEAKPIGIYTKPELREQLKEEIMAGNEGGAPGQWNTRKAQLLVHEYRQAGGGYTFAKRSPTQHQPDWSRPDWHTTDGNTRPQQAWTGLGQRQAINDKKEADAHAGQQPVPSTEAARKKSVNEE